jgi:hypothetical protein
LSTEKIESHPRINGTVIYRYLSRNTHKESLAATEVEKLLEVVAELTDKLELDLGRDLEEDDEDELEIVYPKFSALVAKKAALFKEARDYRLLCLVPSFLLGLAMVGRITRHYIHCPWFTIKALTNMVGDYGGVSGI